MTMRQTTRIATTLGEGSSVCIFWYRPDCKITTRRTPYTIVVFVALPAAGK